MSEGLLVLSEDRTDGNVSLQGLVTVVVEEDTSAGYHWEYGLVVETQGKLDKLNNTVVPGKNVPGAPGLRVFLFEAARVGEAGLIFRFVPPGQTEAARHFSCHIDITKAEN